MTTHREHFEQLATQSLLLAASAEGEGDNELYEIHSIESVLFELTSQATHTKGDDYYKVNYEPYGMRGLTLTVVSKLDRELLQYFQCDELSESLTEIEG